MEAVGPLAARHQAARELVNNHHFPLLHDVVYVALVEKVGLERVIDQVWPLHVAGGVKALHAGEFLRQSYALLGEGDGVLLLLDLKMLVGLELAGDLIGLGVLGDVVVGRAGDDQRRPRFIDEDVIHLVDDREVERALGLLHVLGEAVVISRRHPHVVAEVVEAELVVGAVGDVAGIGVLPLARFHARLDGADGEPEADVERPHPFHVAAGEVVVDGDDVHPLPFQGVEVGRERRHERLALARDHFGDRARVEYHPADELHVVVPHSQEPSPAFPADGERLDENVVERLAGSETPAELGGLAAEFGVAHRLVGGFDRVDCLDLGIEPPEVAGVRRAEESREQTFQAAADSGGTVGDCIPEAFEGFHR